MAISACSTQAVPLEIALSTALSAHCENEPPVLRDDELRGLTSLSAEEREQQFWAPRDSAHRAYELCEAHRADALVAVIARNNQMARQH